MKGLARKGSIKYDTVKDGYSRQVKSLTKRGLVKKSGTNMILTKKGKNRLKIIK